MAQLQQQLAQEAQERPEANGTASLKTCIDKLARYGGMRLITGLIRDTVNMDPRRRALREVFLSDKIYKDARRKLATSLDLWIDVLTREDGNADSMLQYCQTECVRAEECLKDNLLSVREEIRNLEVSYRTIENYFANTGQQKIHHLDVMNVDKENLKDINTDDSSILEKTLKNSYDKIDIKDSYSLLVMPGNIGDATVIRHWAHVAHENKVLIVTDFEDCPTYDDLIYRLDESALQDNLLEMSNVVVACNYILGRRKSEIADEFDDLYIPSSSAIAGRMSDTKNIVISQGVAGRKYGRLDNVGTVRFDMLKSELALLIDKGVVPLIEVDGQVMAFSNCTMYNGSIAGLQEYPITRVFDWVSKVIMQLCNYEVNTIWNGMVEAEMISKFQDFLEKYKGPGNLYESYVINGVKQDPSSKNIIVDIELKPFFAAKNFIIGLTGKKLTNNMMKWEQKIE